MTSLEPGAGTLVRWVVGLLVSTSLALTTTSCAETTTGPAAFSMSGSWGVEGAAGERCGFYASGSLEGTLSAFTGTFLVEEDGGSREVHVSGDEAVISLGDRALLVESAMIDRPAPYLSGSFDCSGESGRWSMWRYAP